MVADPLLQLEDAIGARLAQESLLDFCARVYPGFAAPAHIRYLANLLTRIEAGDPALARTIITLFPGSGKSLLLSLAISWMIGRDPRRRFIVTSAAQRLADRDSRTARGILADASFPFPVRLSADVNSASLWETAVPGGTPGGLYSCGRNGQVVGWGSHYIIGDDLEDGQSSKNELDVLEDWFRTKLLSRLEPPTTGCGSAIILVQARWPRDDLPSRLVRGPGGNRWKVIRMPAIAEADDLLGRPEGAVLWPERFDVAALETQREEMGPRAFAAQYQGIQKSDSAGVIHLDWFQRYSEHPSEVRPRMSRVISWLDSASKTGVRNDWSVIATLGQLENRIYLLDVARARVEFPDLLKMSATIYDKWSPSHFYVEDAASGTQLIQALRSSRIPVIGMKPVGSKESRIEGQTGVIEAGKCFLPTSAPWLGTFEDEISAYGIDNDFDDQTEAFCCGIAVLRPRPNTLTWAAVSCERRAIKYSIY